MRTKMLGTGSGGSKCETVCFLVDKTILIDAPEGIYKKLLKKGIQPKLCLITHFHIDHDFGLPMVMTILRQEIFTIIAPKGAVERYQKLVDLMNYDTNVKFMELPPIIEIDDHMEKNGIEFLGYEILPIKLCHGRNFSGIDAYGYVITKDGKKIGFSGDTVRNAALEKLCEQVDIAFVDITGTAPPSVTPIHMDIDDYKALVRKYPKTKFVPIHMSDTTRADLHFMGVKTPRDGETI